MKKLGILAFALFFTASACRDEIAEFPIDTPDAGQSAPDARVIDRFDAGPIDAGYLPPQLFNVSPSFGPETGGTRVTLRGAGFIEPAQVFFGTETATRVVVLDDVSIAATVPPGMIGAVDVRLVTPGGEAVLAGGFRYHRDLRLTSVSPARIPEEGGVAITIEGKGFDEDTVVLIGRRPIRGQRLVSPERIEGFAPALPPGRPEIHAFTRDAEDRRSDLLLVYATPEIEALVPGYGPIAGSAQALAGDGLQAVEQVQIFGIDAVRFDVAGADRIELQTPALPREGAFDVTVASRDVRVTLVEGFVAYDPRLPQARIVGVAPGAASTEGGELVAIAGGGFTAGAVVFIGGEPAAVVERELPNALVVRVPVGLTVGDHDVEVDLGGGTLLLAPGALRLYEPIVVAVSAPARGPVAGGTAVTITGRGFVPGVEVRIADVPLADVTVVSPTQITGRIVAGAHGPQDIVVKSDDTRGVLTGGFFFEEAFEVIRVDPFEGSVAGNTLVSVLGRGFTGTVALSFDGVPGLGTALENGSVISTRTQPAPSGPADVEVRTRSGEATLPDAYTFYDPRIITGGVWGGEIQGSVNVGVMDIQSGEPVPGMVVQLGYDADPRYAAITDENGLATISAPEIRGPQTVTAGRNQFEFVTYTEVNARNLTMFTSAYPQSMPPDAPVSPCPTGGAAPIVRGRVFRFKSSLDPVTRPGWLPVARITYSQPSVFGTNPPDPPEQVDFVFADGEQFEIVVMRGATVAVYAILGDFNVDTQEFIPRKMGIVRSVPAGVGGIIEGVNISLDIELDQEVDLRLDDPPVQVPGPSFNAVFPYLNLGSDGVIAFDPAVVPEGSTIRLTGLPSYAGADFFYLAGSFTVTPDGALGAPYSLTLAQSDDDASDGLDIGPFLKMPEDVTPKPGQVAPGGVFSWTQPGIQPDLVSIYVADVVGVSGRCCLDVNANGQCDVGEPVQSGGAPVQFSRWSLFGPGGLMSYALPRMPSGVNAFVTPQLYTWVTQTAIAPRFNYDEWIYNQYSPYFWKSWTLSFDQFLTKEETD